MISINSITFAKNDKDFMDSLFKGSRTCFGYYKLKNHEILLYDHKLTLFAAIIKNKEGYFFGNACLVPDTGKIFYQVTLSPNKLKLFGLDVLGFKASREFIANLYESIMVGYKNKRRLEQR